MFFLFCICATNCLFFCINLYFVEASACLFEKKNVYSLFLGPRLCPTFTFWSYCDSAALCLCPVSKTSWSSRHSSNIFLVRPPDSAGLVPSAVGSVGSMTSSQGHILICPVYPPFQSASCYDLSRLVKIGMRQHTWIFNDQLTNHYEFLYDFSNYLWL